MEKARKENNTMTKKEEKQEPTFEAVLTNGQRLNAEDMIDQTPQEYIFQNVTLFVKDKEEIEATFTELYILKSHVFYSGYNGEPVNRNINVKNGRQ
jgi:hypothetical protein